MWFYKKNETKLLFFIHELDKLGLATTIKQAKRHLKEKNEVWDALEHIIETPNTFE